MGEIVPALPVKLFCGMLAADPDVMLRAGNALTRLYGDLDWESDLMAFDFTDYYEDEMGTGLQRKFVSFATLIDPGKLAEVKIRTNGLEQELARDAGGRRRRRINLDPGYVDASRLVLATTKNVAHRIYLGQGIYAEVTLTFRKNGCAYFDWTYPDYRSDRYADCLREIRRRYQDQVSRSAEPGHRD